jgi:solute carrier family 13 (sodium-dependent dicarboxylate transporter), member 2/3/5
MAAIDTSAADPHVAAPQERNLYWRISSVLICIAIPLIIGLAPLPIEPRTQLAFAITSFMILAWMTNVMEYAAAGLVGCTLYWASGVVEPEIAFAGFANDTTWFVLGAILLGLIATKSGLPQRIGSFVVTRVGGSYSYILLGLIITDFLLTFVVPTGAGRLVIMASIGIGIIKLFDAPASSNIARGIFLIITYTAAIFDKMIIAGAGAITARGNIERFGGVDVTWSTWFFAFIPCALLTIFVGWWLTLWLFPPEQRELPAGRLRELHEQMRVTVPWTPHTIKAALIVLLAITVWMTDQFHDIDAALVAFGAAMIALLPFVGVLNVEDIKKTNLMPFFFVGAALSMSEVLRDTGGLTLLTNTVFSGLEPFLRNEAVAVPVLYWGAFFYHFFLASELSMLATSLPILMGVAKEHMLDPLWIGLVWSFAAGGKLFVYQSAVLVVGYSYGFFRHMDMVKLGAALTIIEFFALAATVAFWWPLIGLSGN